MAILIFLAIAYTCFHAQAIAHHTWIMVLYKQVCGHCDWWWDKGYKWMLYSSYIPIFGPFVCIAAHGDIVRNIILELSKPDA